MDCRQRIAFSNLHEWVKQRVADLRLLSPEMLADKAFSGLRPLEGSVAERILMDLSSGTDAAELPWLSAFGHAVSRVNLDDEIKTAVARAAGLRLLETRIRVLPSIQVTPYFEDKPAGTARQEELAWTQNGLFTVPLSSARRARLLPEHLGRSMPADSLREALIYCCDRPVPDVVRYMEENFDLTEEHSPSSAKDHPQPPRENPATPDPPPTDQPDPPQAGEQPLSEDPPETLPEPGPDTPEEPELDPAPPKNRKPSGPSLMERFALTRGFHRDGEAFIHLDGSRLVKEAEGGFGWCLNDAASGKTRHLRAIDACLERQPLEIPHECWTAMERTPDTHSLVLLNPQGLPVEVTGENLCRMRHEGIVSLFPASYRLRQNRQMR